MPELDYSKIRVAVAATTWNSAVTDEMLAGAIDALRGRGIPDDAIRVVRCPGAYELPLAVKWLLEMQEDGRPAYDAIVAIGAVIRGGTPHFDYVCDAVNRGVTGLILQFGRPVGFGVLTTDTVAQALERAGRSKGNKGAEAALAACSMLELQVDLGGGIV